MMPQAKVKGQGYCGAKHIFGPNSTIQIIKIKYCAKPK